MEINLEIDGMHCATCAQGIEKQLNKVPAVEKATVNLVTETAYIKSNEDISPDILIDAVKKAGYDAFLSEE